MQVFEVPCWPSSQPSGRRVQRQGSLLAYGRPYKTFNRSTREVVSSRATLPSHSETHVLLLQDMFLTTNTRECFHTTDEERALTGTWVIDEVRLAVQKLYMILEVHELYEYYVTRYDPETREGGLFADYIDTFLKLKDRRGVIPPGFEARLMKSDE